MRLHLLHEEANATSEAMEQLERIVAKGYKCGIARWSGVTTGYVETWLVTKFPGSESLDKLMGDPNGFYLWYEKTQLGYHAMAAPSGASAFGRCQMCLGAYANLICACGRICETCRDPAGAEELPDDVDIFGVDSHDQWGDVGVLCHKCLGRVRALFSTWSDLTIEQMAAKLADTMPNPQLAAAVTRCK